MNTPIRITNRELLKMKKKWLRRYQMPDTRTEQSRTFTGKH